MRQLDSVVNKQEKQSPQSSNSCSDNQFIFHLHKQIMFDNLILVIIALLNSDSLSQLLCYLLIINFWLFSQEIIMIVIVAFIIFIKMLGWISRCWGGMGVTSQFQKARLRSVIPDSKVPDDEDVCILINSFKGQNPQIQPQNAFNMFFSNLEMSEQKSDPLFLLKHLYILDHTVEERICLNKIAAYYCSEFQAFKQNASIEYNSLRDLVATYFVYIRRKAEIYSQLDPPYFSTRKKQREEHINSINFSQTFSLIDKCFELQKCVNEINASFKNHNKSADIVQMVFTMLLKTYLFCYTLVSISAKALFSKLKKWNRAQVGKFYKFIKYYNKEYTKNLYDFLQSNKEIYEFKVFNYREIIMIEKCYIQYLQNFMRRLENQPLALMGNDTLNVQEQNKIQNLPEDIQLQLKQHIKIAYRPRKIFKMQPVDPQLEDEFNQYVNFYAQSYESELQTSKRDDYNIQLASNGGIMDTSMVASKGLTAGMKHQFEQSVALMRFDEQIWKNWKNVYSS